MHASSRQILTGVAGREKHGRNVKDMNLRRMPSETGKAFALCSAFQTMIMPQTDLGPTELDIRIPSLYGIVSSLSAPRVLDGLRQFGITVSDQ